LSLPAPRRRCSWLLLAVTDVVLQRRRLLFFFFLFFFRAVSHDWQEDRSGRQWGPRVLPRSLRDADRFGAAIT